jgi:preprotein translocase subunit SecF
MRAFLSRLYRGESNFDFIKHRRRWYLASGLLIVVCIFSFIFRGFNVGIDFKGGTELQLPKTSSVTSAELNAAMAAVGHPADGAIQVVGTGSDEQFVAKTKQLTADESTSVPAAVAARLNISPNTISVDTVSSTWGGEITKKAVEGLVVFLIAVFFYIALRFEWKMAVAAETALLHDLVISAGIYSLVGFELTPSTVVGLLTILGFSLYDTVVVFDKIAENVKGLKSSARMTYAEAANLAVNQTLMRSINTSLISLLPVAGLLFVGAGLLGVGTIKDLALILFVGLAVGAYSSLFLATPVLVELKELDPENKRLNKRVLDRRRAGAVLDPAVAGAAVLDSPLKRSGPRSGPAPAPRPGARPQRKPRNR